MFLTLIPRPKTTGCIHFGDIVFEADTMRKQLTDLATGLKDVVKQISPETKVLAHSIRSAQSSRSSTPISPVTPLLPFSSSFQLKNMEAEKRQKTHYFQSVASRLGNDNTQILNRKQIIEKKKEDLERLQHEKAMEEQKKLQMDEAERKKSEEERLKKAASDRLGIQVAWRVGEARVLTPFCFLVTQKDGHDGACQETSRSSRAVGGAEEEVWKPIGHRRY
jgi:hypothetical protein